MILIEYIFVKHLKWTLNIFQNVISLCGMIPLRLYDLNSVDKEWEDFYESMGEVDISSLEKDPNTVWSGLVDRSGKKPGDIDAAKQEAPWLTIPSYPLPLWTEAMKSANLLSCKTAYIYHWLKQLKKEGRKTECRYLIKNFLLVGCKRLDLPGQDLYLVAGPVLRFAEKGQTGEAFYKQILRPLIDYFTEWTKDSADDSTQSERARMMDIMGSLRPFLDDRHFEDRLEKASNSFERLLLLEWPGEEILRRCMCREMARDSWVLHTTSANEILHKLTREKPKKNSWLENVIVIFPISTNESSLTKHNHYLLRVLIKEKNWHLELTPISKNEKLDSPKIEWIKKQEKSLLKKIFFQQIIGRLLKFFKKTSNIEDKLAGVEDNLVYFWQWIDKRIDSMEIAYAQEKLIFLEQWFRAGIRPTGG